MNSDEKIQRWVRPQLRALNAYHVPDATGLIKLDAMENPYSLPGELTSEWLECLREVELNRYPDPAARALRAALAVDLNLPAGQDILLGNGSDELIQILAMVLGGVDRTILAPEPGFSMYRIIAGVLQTPFKGVPLKADFTLDMDAMCAAIEHYQPAVIFLAYPNNPTGNMWSRADVEEVLRLAPGPVIIDEAYAPFAADSFIPDLGRYDNLLVLRTVSKLGLAGLRLGMLLGPVAWLAEFDKARLPYNINVLTQASALFALQHADVFAAQAQCICAERAHLLAALGAMKGIRPWPSATNFILFETPPGQATDIFSAIREQGVLIKNLSAPGRLQDSLRVTVGRPEDNSAFLEALKTALERAPA